MSDVTRLTAAADFRRAAIDIVPVLVAAVPIGLLWGTLATGRGLSVFEAWAMSAFVFAGASQFVAIDMWREPVPWLLLGFTAFVVNVRHMLMSASLSRHLGQFQPKSIKYWMFFLTDEVWAFGEREVLKRPLTPAYYAGLGLPMWMTWTVSCLTGAALGQALRDPSAYGFDFAFSAMFIGIVAGFWRGPRTGAVLGVSAATAAVMKLAVSGPWYIVAGGIAGALTAATLHVEPRKVGS